MMTIEKLERFIDKNLDYLYENRTKNVMNLLFDGSLEDDDLANNLDFKHL